VGQILGIKALAGQKLALKKFGGPKSNIYMGKVCFITSILKKKQFFRAILNSTRAKNGLLASPWPPLA
jgi:hypothetical protein